MVKDSIPFIFFGSSRFSVLALDALMKKGFVPSLIVSTPDKPQGRKMIVTPNVTKIWALGHNIPCITPGKLDEEAVESLKKEIKSSGVSVFVVASYGKIIPKAVLELPARHTLNIHPSLLPTYRGASPLQSAILDDSKDTGVTIMRIDEQMDHGPIVASVPVKIEEWPTYEEFEALMAKKGSDMLTDILPKWVKGEVKEIEQDHDKATYTKKIKKEDALITLDADAYDNFRKIQAYHEWPVAYFMQKHRGKEIKVKVTKASYDHSKNLLIIDRVVPEGGKEMDYDSFIRGYSS